MCYCDLVQSKETELPDDPRAEQEKEMPEDGVEEHGGEEATTDDLPEHS